MTVDSDDRSDGAVAAGERARPPMRPVHWLAIVAFSMVVPVLALYMATARGPTYLEVNTDPEYAYLLNALRIAEGYAPHLIEHPGTPAQCVGAAALRLVHMVSPRGTFRDDVLLRPELFLVAFRTAIVLVTTALSFVGGLLAYRGTGRVACAAAVQLSPLFGWAAATDMDRPMPEPLMIGFGLALSGSVLLTLRETPQARGGRMAMLMGLFSGIAVATKMLFAPMALVPFAALATWRHRAAYAGWATLFLMVSLLPMASQVGRTLDWIKLLASHTGRYGAGQAGVIDKAEYLHQARHLVYLEGVYFVLAAAGLAAAVLAFVREAHSDGQRRVRRTLIATSLAQFALLAVVAKHPAAHYLGAGASLGGLTLCLIALVAEDICRSRVLVSTSLVLAAVAAGAWNCRLIRQMREELASFRKLEIGTAAALHTSENAGMLEGIRISTPESALHFGNFYSGYLYTDDLERLYPGVLFWDWTGITAFGRPATDAEIARAREGGALRALVSIWFDPHKAKPADLEITTVRSLGRERFILASAPMTPESATEAFSGFHETRGLGGVEGPYPQMNLPFLVRWAIADETVMRFDSPGGPMQIILDGRPSNVQGQVMEVAVDGVVVARHEYLQPPQFELVTAKVDAAAGPHEIRLRFTQSEQVGKRGLRVLFRRIRIAPAP